MNNFDIKNKGENIMKGILTLEDVKKDNNFRNKFKSITLYDGECALLNKEKIRVKEGKPKYKRDERNNRSGSAVAKITPNTLAIYTSENIDYPEPRGWSKKIDEAKVYDKTEGTMVKVFQKCHIIAYSLSARNTVKDNMFIGTKHLNKESMRKIEIEIYNDVKQNKRKYLYRVTPIYKSKEDVVPLGILIEAKTIDNGERKQYCEFCYNIQKGAKINYYDGGFKPIEKVYETRKIEKDETKEENKENESNKYRKYDIEIETKTFHLSSKKCEDVIKIIKSNPEKIQETKACKEDIIKHEKEGFKLCKKCVK